MLSASSRHWVILGTAYWGEESVSGTREYNPGLSPESGSDPLPCCSGITVVVLQKSSEWTAREEVGLFFFFKLYALRERNGLEELAISLIGDY